MKKDEIILKLEKLNELVKEKQKDLQHDPFYTGLGGGLTVSGLIRNNYFNGKIDTLDYVLKLLREME